jgi:hypothetical protein
MHGDTVRAGALGEPRRRHRIGIGDTARLTHRRHVIDIDAQANHYELICNLFIEPRVMVGKILTTMARRS